ncbi:MAG: hypothetical protein ACOYNF_11680 [Rhodoferax sp.]
MKARTSLFSLLLLTAVSGVAAQSLSRDAEQLTTRPLNLSMRKQTAPPTDPALIVIGQPAQSTSPTQNVTAGSNEETGGAASLPYGAGFESRQQGSTSGSGSTGGTGNSGNSGSGNGAGNGGGGRGGAGRGR